MAHLKFEFRDFDILSDVEGSPITLIEGITSVMAHRPDIASILITSVMAYTNHYKIDLHNEQQKLGDILQIKGQN